MIVRHFKSRIIPSPIAHRSFLDAARWTPRHGHQPQSAHLSTEYPSQPLSWRQKYGYPIINFFLWTSLTVLGLEYVYTVWDMEDEKIKFRDRIGELEKRLGDSKTEKQRVLSELASSTPTNSRTTDVSVQKQPSGGLCGWLAGK
ncbi:hypothetical protein M427DRAFT_133424 [Gonapodya prolifera JEL478]|uniref:Uncharacterized protein n=1 Tax=Gonapodya prolifera (strain JEL478) TaxID=1344416 RepID=A0A139AM93_GONPJ|nr:hypothetical protein M427DRAFT_133424 [Gonapodya prolifera JEL478]|eukprot:KXS17633.1 hypothetical protein M427DRAFT_133424 [Gonapodya prolifera JEL478]